MAETRDVVTVLRSYYEAARLLPDKADQADFLMSILGYAFDGEAPGDELSPAVQAMCRLVTPVLDANQKRGGRRSSVTAQEPPEEEPAPPALPSAPEVTPELLDSSSEVTPQSLPSHSEVTTELPHLKDKGVKDKGVKDKGDIIQQSLSARAHEEPEEPPPNDLGRVMQLFQDRVSPFPTREAIDLLKSYTESLGGDVVCHAINSALEENKPQWAYIRGILRAYERDGITSMEAVQRREYEHQLQKIGTSRSRASPMPPAPPKPVDVKALQQLADRL